MVRESVLSDMKAARKSRETNQSTYLADLHLGHRKQSGGKWETS